MTTGRLAEPGRALRDAAREARAVLARALPGFPGEAGVLVGFSGGPDSTVLLRLLAEEARRRGERRPGAVVAAHLDHGLQPDSAEAGESAARAARKLGIPCVVGRRDVAALAARRRRSLQEAAREARLRFLGETAAARGLAAVALGHTLSDQAETLLLRLARGAGTAGLGAMRPAGPLSEEFAETLLVRPLLRVSRPRIEAILREKKWPFRDDPSNRSPRFARNRVRHGSLARLRAEVNPAADAALGRAADLLRDDEDWMSGEAERVFAALSSRPAPRGPEVHLPAAGLAGLHPALARRVIRLGLARTRGHLRRIGLVHIEDILEMIRAGRGGASLDLPGARVRLAGGVLRIEARRGRASP